MSRNQFKCEGDEYWCPRCMLGLHTMCSEPGVCQCPGPVEDDPEIESILYADNTPYAVTYKTPAGKPEDEDLSQEVDPVLDDPEPPTLADLRTSHQSVTEAHRKTGHI